MANRPRYVDAEMIESAADLRKMGPVNAFNQEIEVK